MARNISSVTIVAAAERVWAVLTEPELVKHWQYGSQLTTSWNVGSEIRFETQWQDQIFKQWGTVLEFTPCEKLRYSLFAPSPGVDDKPENYFEMQYVLTPRGGVTLLEIIQVDDRHGAVQEAAQDETSNPILAALKSQAEA